MLCSSVLQYASILLVAVHLQVNARRFYKNFEQYDVLVVATCEAKCWEHIHRNTCIKLCLLRGFDKAGSCPRSEHATTLSSYDGVCLRTCKIDSECIGIAKCCKHQCNITCQPPLHLQHARDLPDVPSDITIKARRKRTVYIKWKKNVHQSATHFVIEERHHAGKYFIENHMGDWNPCYRSTKPAVALRHVIKPGRWYQFRVAAINQNGTKGFSDPITYIAQIGPKRPKAPDNMIVGPLWNNNGSLHTELKWSKPQSDLPLQKYKVYWSRRLYGVTALDAVLVQQQTTTSNQTKFIINNLDANSLYFLQVQAIAQYGKDILKGEKSGFVLNTTNYRNITHLHNIPANSFKTVENVELQKLFWSKGELKARISWKSKSKHAKYALNWRRTSCKGVHNDLEQSKYTAVVKGSHFDVYDLQFDCRYHVSIREAVRLRKQLINSFVTFTTPPCKQLQINNKRIKCKRSLF